MKKSFAEITNQVNLINNVIISDLKYDDNKVTDQESNFTKRLTTMKYWFTRISWVNKKRYLLTLLHDVKSVWTLSLLLKSSWNCRPKDSVMSVCQVESLSSFDEVPLDHNRTALPVTVLAQVMKTDRFWFLTLEPEPQALVLCELLPVGGGPLMWEVLRRARARYDRYCDNLVENLLSGAVTIGGRRSNKELKQDSSQKSELGVKSRKESKKDLRHQEELPKPEPSSKAQKELDAHLATWAATLKSIRDTQKLEELEMTGNDGTTRKIWKVNRPRPEVVECVDFLQLLPSAIGKRILSFLPRATLPDYARVNKYWAYLVDELKVELSARARIDGDLEKLIELMARYEPSSEMFVASVPEARGMSIALSAQGQSLKNMKHTLLSMRAPSEKSAGGYSMKNFMANGKLNKPFVPAKPIRNMKDLTERLEKRGAADEALWKWCKVIKRRAKHNNGCTMKPVEGVLGNVTEHFPCPYMKWSVHLPLSPPLYQDPVKTSEVKPKRNPSNATILQAPKEHKHKRYNLWTRNLTSLFPVYKIPSYQSPV